MTIDWPSFAAGVAALAVLTVVAVAACIISIVIRFDRRGWF